MTVRLDPRLKGFASDMRSQPTPIEAALWREISHSQLGGYKFRRQAVLGPYIADFFCASIGLVVELDGRTHTEIGDARRDKAMNDMGFEVLRFGNRELGVNMSGVLTTILEVAKATPPRFDKTPPLQGRGERRRACGCAAVGMVREAEAGSVREVEANSAAPSFPTPSPSPEGEGNIAAPLPNISERAS